MMKKEIPFYHISDKHCRVSLHDRWRIETMHINGREILFTTEAERPIGNAASNLHKITL